jgi:hypothetical protein
MEDNWGWRIIGMEVVFETQEILFIVYLCSQSILARLDSPSKGPKDTIFLPNKVFDNGEFKNIYHSCRCYLPTPAQTR